MTKIVRTILPVAPREYDSNYVNQLARNLDRVIDEQRNPLTNIPNLPSDGAANVLETGDLFQADGFLRIVRENDIFSGSVSATGAVGTVTVSTT